jgi:hypothetical protein
MAVAPFSLNFAVLCISAIAGMRVTSAGGRGQQHHPRHAAVVCWTGETSATVEIRDVPVSVLYEGYADLTRMTEWSPLLHSVTVDSQLPSHSVWVMRIPGALTAAARTLGYPETVSWEADLDAPGPPSMNWTSTLDESGRLKGLPNAGGRWPGPGRGDPSNRRPCPATPLPSITAFTAAKGISRTWRHQFDTTTSERASGATRPQPQLAVSLLPPHTFAASSA